MIYVTMTDKFMSGWGKADGKTNKLIFLCETMEQANTVMDNAESRSDMKRVNICTNEPHYSSKKVFAQIKTIQNYPCWYKPGYFSAHR